MKSLLSIGEVSQITDLSIQTLRHYHHIDLLVPKYIDPGSGYRYYSLDQLVYIDIIKTCKSLGTSLSDLKKLFKEKDIHTLLCFLETQKQVALDNIATLHQTVSNIENFSESIHSSNQTLLEPSIQTKILPERFIGTLPCHNVNTQDILIDYAKVNQLIREQGYIPDVSTGILYKPKIEHPLSPTHIFGTIKDSTCFLENECFKSIPKGTYLCISYTEATENTQLTKLFNYLSVYNLTPKLMVEVYLLTYLFYPETYSCELQILV